MKKTILALTLIPSLSFASIDSANVEVYAGTGFVNNPIVCRGVYDFTVSNPSNSERTYHYKYMLCPAEHHCEEHESKVTLKPHSMQAKNYSMDKYIKYNSVGSYTVTASIHIWHGDDDKYAEKSTQIKVMQ